MWLAAAFVLLLMFVPLGVLVLRAPIGSALVAAQLGGTLFVLILLLLAQGMGRSSYVDLALGSALLTVPSGFLVAHFFERWL